MKYKTIDEYIGSFPAPVVKALAELRAAILKAVPDAEELFNYNIPAFGLVPNSKRDQQIMMAGYAKHVGLYPHPTVMEHFASELRDYKQGKGSVQFPIGKPVPVNLVIRMVKYRRKMLES